MKDLFKILLIGGGIFFLLKDQIMDALSIKTVEAGEEPAEEPPAEPPAEPPPAEPPAEPPAKPPAEPPPALPRIAEAMAEEADRTSGLNWDQWNYYYTVITGTPGLGPELVLAPFDRATDVVPVMTIEEWAGAMRRHGINLGRLPRVGIA